MHELELARKNKPCDLVCPHCGLRWNETEEHWYDGEYGYFMLDKGKTTIEVTCEQCDKYRLIETKCNTWKLTGSERIRGCGKRFRFTRNVNITVKHSQED